MIEVTVLQYLRDVLQIPTFCEMQTDEIDSFLIVEKTGGYVENYINHATIVVQSYAKSLYDAIVLNDQVKEAMADIIYDTNIQSCKINSDYNFTDQEKKKYRYQAVFELVY